MKANEGFFSIFKKYVSFGDRFTSTNVSSKSKNIRFSEIKLDESEPPQNTLSFNIDTFQEAITCELRILSEF